MKKIKSIALDMDGVIVDMLDSLLKECEKRDLSYVPNKLDIFDWDFSKAFNKEDKEKVDEIFHEKGFFFNLKPMEDAIESIKFLNKKYDLYITTAIPKDSEYAYQDKKNWVRKNLPFLNIRNFIGITPKEIIFTDILLDDGPHNLEKFKFISVKFKHNYNLFAKSDFSVANWKEFIYLINKLNG